MKEIIGKWENDEILYIFYEDSSLIIKWKKKNIKNSGRYFINENKIYFEYGKNFYLKWNGTIEILDEFKLFIKDDSNEIGVIDKLYRVNINENTTKEDSQSFININNLENYPQVLISHSIIQILKKQDYERLPIPEFPTKQTINANMGYKFGLIIIGIIFIFIFMQAEMFNLMSIGSILVVVGFFWLALFPENKKIIKSNKEYIKKIEKYEILYNDYLESEKITDKEFDSYMRKKILLKKFIPVNRLSYNLEDYKKGRSNDYFKIFLNFYFGSGENESKGIYENIGFIESFYENKPYIMDFAYIDPKINLIINIEIDEPYTLDDKEIIHIDDNKRNEYFLEKNFIIIRFAEEQVIKYPGDCCNLISEIISIFENFTLNSMKVDNQVKIVKKWDINEAKYLIKNNYREEYLKLLTNLN